MQISVVIPLYNEQESLPELAGWIARVMLTHHYTYEIIFIDDGSIDGSWKEIEKLVADNPHVRGIRFRKNYGKSAGLQVGFTEAKGDVVITMDADLQDSPNEIPALYDMITRENFDLVSGWKQKRYDPFIKTFPTKIYNAATRMVTGLQLHDMNCGLKAYKNVLVKNIEVYGEMHRYLPVLARKAGYRNIGEKVVQHQARKYGVTKFGMERFLYGFLDLLSVSFMTRFANRHMHIFGGLGALSFLFGFIVMLYLTIAKFVFSQYRMTERPIFYLGLVSLIIGVQLFVSGFLGELISRKAVDRNEYDIAQSIGAE